MTDGKIRLTAADASYAEVDLPVVPYRSVIGLPFSFSRLDNKRYVTGDLGAAYDKYSCRCDLEIDEDQAFSLFTFFDSHRSESFTLTIDETSGFDPFTPLRGNAGPFQVSARLSKRRGMLLEPFKYFGYELSMVNTGSWPSYSLPTQREQGSLAIAGVSGIDFPETYFEPDLEYSNEVTHSEGSVAFYLDRGAQADSAISAASLRLNRGKCAALVTALVDTFRAGSFTMSAAAGQYIFGREHGDDATHTVNLVQETIEVEVHGPDDYRLRLRVQRADTQGEAWQDTDGAAEIIQDTDGAAEIIQDHG